MDREKMNDLKSMKAAYQMFKYRGDKERIHFLDALVSYCKFIGFNKDKTLMMLALIRNFVPEPGQKFTECDQHRDEIDDAYTTKIMNEFDAL